MSNELKLSIPEGQPFIDYEREFDFPVADVFRARGLARTRLAGGEKGEGAAAAVAAALDDYTWALKLEPDARGHALRGWLYLVAQSPHLALEDFNKALRLDRQCAEALNGP